jgi:NADPH2:quinone reductase
MKAVLSKIAGGPDSLTMEELPEPRPASGEVGIRVRAVGVNYPDALIIEDKYQFKPQRPFSPGGEISGEVIDVGAGVTRFVPGDRVIGFCGWGGMAEKVVLPEDRCTPMPASMSFEEAAAFLFTYGTSHYALKWRGALKSGEKILILGAAGGVGLAALELAKAAGARVIAACSSRDKVDFCLAKGADKGLVYPKGNLDKAAQKDLSGEIKAVADGSVDLVYDAVGGDYAEPALRCLDWGGRYLVIGFPAGIPSIPLNLTLLKSCDIRGVFWGAWVDRFPDEYRQSLKELARLYDKGKIRPHVSSIYSLEKAPEAIGELLARRAKGKIVVKID